MLQDLHDHLLWFCSKCFLYIVIIKMLKLHNRKDFLYIIGFWRKNVIFCENGILDILGTGATFLDFRYFKMKITPAIFKINTLFLRHWTTKDRIEWNMQIKC